MRSLLLALCIALPLTACLDTTGAQGPPPKFSPGVQAHFEQYMRELNPSLFVVSEDGQTAFYTYCPAHADRCIDVSSSGATKSSALRDCETNSGGIPCHVYAVGRRIVWKGTPASGQVSGANNAADYEVCNWAITMKDGSAVWETRTAWLGHVNEAKRRDLTPDHCAEILDR